MKKSKKVKSPLATLIPDLPHRDLEKSFEYNEWVQEFMRGVVKVLDFFHDETITHPERILEVTRGLAVALNEAANVFSLCGASSVGGVSQQHVLRNGGGKLEQQRPPRKRGHHIHRSRGNSAVLHGGHEEAA